VKGDEEFTRCSPESESGIQTFSWDSFSIPYGLIIVSADIKSLQPSLYIFFNLHRPLQRIGTSHDDASNYLGSFNGYKHMRTATAMSR
jgi:hypothetical protein